MQRTINQQRYRQARFVTLVGAVINLLLSLFKIVFGWLGHSNALIADGVHSLSDLITDFLVLLAAKAGSQEPDSDHPYGHERIETIATTALAVFLIIVGLAIAADGVKEIVSGDYGQLPSFSVLIVAAASVLANEFLFRYTLHFADKTESDLLRSNAWHSRSDALSSLVVLVGAIGTLLGVHFMDSAAAIIVAGMIIYMGGKMSWRSILELVDTGVSEEKQAKLLKTLQQTPGAKAVHQLRTRTMAGQCFVDVHLQVDPEISVSEGHYIADQAHRRLYQSFSKVKDITIHIDPENDEEAKPCIDLPDREQLMKTLADLWGALPGWDQLLRVRLDYLGGKIYIQPVIPLSILEQYKISGKALQKQYKQAVSQLEEVGDVTINLVAM